MQHCLAAVTLGFCLSAAVVVSLAGHDGAALILLIMAAIVLGVRARSR